MIELKNLSYSYPSTSESIPALNNITLTIPKNKITCILGANGCGKSTLAKLVCGLLKPTSGDIIVNGQKQTKQRNMLVSLVSQNPDSQLVATTVEEDIAFGPKNLGLTEEQVKNRLDWALTVLNLKALAKKEPHHLSAGQRQKVVIAGIIALKPSYIFFDEATSRLDNVGKKEVNQLYKQLVKLGITPIIISQNVDDALLADKIIILAHGRVLATGGQDLLQDKRILSQALLCPNAILAVSQELAAKGLPIKPTSNLNLLVNSLCKLK